MKKYFFGLLFLFAINVSCQDESWVDANGTLRDTWQIGLDGAGFKWMKDSLLYQIVYFKNSVKDSAQFVYTKNPKGDDIPQLISGRKNFASPTYFGREGHPGIIYLSAGQEESPGTIRFTTNANSYREILFPDSDFEDTIAYRSWVKDSLKVRKAFNIIGGSSKKLLYQVAPDSTGFLLYPNDSTKVLRGNLTWGTIKAIKPTNFLNGFHTTLINDTMFVSLDLENPLKISGSQLAIQKADSTHDGYISKEDFQRIATGSSLVYYEPFFVDDGALQITKADSTHDGYLAKEDFRRFGSSHSNFNFSPAFYVATDTTGTNIALSLNSPLYTDYTNSRLAITKADLTHDGYLSKEDFGIFKNGSINGYKYNFSHGIYSSLVNDTLYISADVDAPLKIDGNQIAIQKADSSHDGYLAKEDFRKINSSSISIAPVGTSPIEISNAGNSFSVYFNYNSPLRVDDYHLNIDRADSTHNGYMASSMYSNLVGISKSSIKDTIQHYVSDVAGDLNALLLEVDSLSSANHSSLSVHWNNITHKPTSYTPSSHIHTTSDILVSTGYYLNGWMGAVEGDLTSHEQAIDDLYQSIGDMSNDIWAEIGNLWSAINNL